MRSILPLLGILLLGMLLSGPAAAQSATDPTPEEQLRAKLASPFLEKASWHLDYDKALAAAARDRKLIFGYFTTAGY